MLDIDANPEIPWPLVAGHLNDRTKGNLANICRDANSLFRADENFQASKADHNSYKQRHAPIIQSFFQEEFDQRNNGGGHQRSLGRA